MKRKPTLVFFLFVALVAHGQGTWTPRAGFPVANVDYAQAMYIAGKGYVVGGRLQTVHAFTPPAAPAACPPPNGALSLDDVDDYVELSQWASNLIYNSPATVEFWLKMPFPHLLSPPSQATSGVAFAITDGWSNPDPRLLICGYGNTWEGGGINNGLAHEGQSR